MLRFLAEAEAAIEQIRKGKAARDLESPTLDFKEEKGSLADLEKTIAEAAICFANSAGGIVVIGVSDNTPGPEAFSGTRLAPERIRQRVFELSRPPLTVDAARHSDFPNLVLVFVPQSAELHSDTQGRAYRRINLDCIPMTPGEQARLREERQGIDWSAADSGRAVSEASDEAVAMARRMLGAFADERRRLAAAPLEDILSALGALHTRTELNRAGALMFCPPSSGQGNSVTYQYRGTPGGEPQLVQRLQAPLLLSFLRVMELIEARQTSTPITLPNGQQLTIDDFPSLAVREAVSNAICHRDYRLLEPIAIDHSPQVLIVESPGPLVAGVTPANIITTTSRPRNPALSRIARTLGLAEELGRGVDRMVREMIRSGRDVPHIDGSFDRVRVTLVGGAPNTNIARFVAQLPEAEREDTDTMLVLFHLCRKRLVNATSLAPWLQKSPQEAQAILRRLADDTVGLLELTRSTASKASPSYRLRGEALRGLGAAVEYNRRTTDETDRKVMAHLQEYGRITNRTLQNFFDVGVFKARDIIADLVARGVLVRISEQTRGPKVEWGPGPMFPAGNKRRAPRKSPSDRAE